MGHFAPRSGTSAGAANMERLLGEGWGQGGTPSKSLQRRAGDGPHGEWLVSQCCTGLA